jgi:hypothetical protein
MAYVTASGTTIGISTTVHAAATDTLAEYQALTYTSVGGVRTLGRFGDRANQVKFAVLGDGRMRTLAGARDAGVLDFVCAFDALDAGQLDMIAAADDGQSYDFKVVTNDGTSPNPDSEFYFTGLVLASELDVGENDSVLSMAFNVAVNSTVYRDLSAPP